MSFIAWKFADSTSAIDCLQKKLYLAVFLCNFIQTYCENLKVLSKIHSSFLDKYSSYADVVILNFNVPPDLKFVSFKFEAEEVNLSFFSKLQ